MCRTLNDVALIVFHYVCYMPVSTDPAPQAVYSSAYPQGSSVFQNKIATMGI